MDKLPELARLSEPEKDALIVALWAEVQRLKAQLAALEAKSHEPRKDALVLVSVFGPVQG